MPLNQQIIIDVIFILYWPLLSEFSTVEKIQNSQYLYANDPNSDFSSKFLPKCSNMNHKFSIHKFFQNLYFFEKIAPLCTIFFPKFFISRSETSSICPQMTKWSGSVDHVTIPADKGDNIELIAHKYWTSSLAQTQRI